MSGSVWYVPRLTVVSGGRSFHSWQATSQALQPMQVEVSMSFATTWVKRMPGEAAPAEAFFISSACVAMASSSLYLFYFHKEALVFRGKRVRIHDRRSDDVGHGTGLLAASKEAPVNGESNLVHGL